MQERMRKVELRKVDKEEKRERGTSKSRYVLVLWSFFFFFFCCPSPVCLLPAGRHLSAGNWRIHLWWMGAFVCCQHRDCKVGTLCRGDIYGSVTGQE